MALRKLPSLCRQKTANFNQLSRNYSNLNITKSYINNSSKLLWIIGGSLVTLTWIKYKKLTAVHALNLRKVCL